MAIFAQNMNENPVYPSWQNGERPYPEAPKWQFSDPWIGRFPHPEPVFLAPYPYPTCLFLSFNPVVLEFIFLNT